MASLTDWLLQTDEVTVALGLGLAAVFLLGSYLTPQSLVHPILLGRQSDVERVRKPGESAVYRNYGTGLSGRLSMRPSKEVVLVTDLIKPDFQTPRTLWSTTITNAELKLQIEALGNGLVRDAGLVPEKSSVLLLLNDGFEFLVTDLALAAHSIKSYTIASLTLLSAVLDQQSLPFETIILQASSIGYVLELLAEGPTRRDLRFIVVTDEPLPDIANQLNLSVTIWEKLVTQGKHGSPVQTNTPEPEDTFSVSYYASPDDELKATQLSHLNLTAGVTATRVLLPLNAAISPLDSILSSHSLSTPFGRAIAYSALYDGAHFATTDSTAIVANGDVEATSSRKSDLHTSCTVPSATILFLTNPQLRSIAYQIIKKANDSWLYWISWRHKQSAVQQGAISKDTIWDRYTLEGPRTDVLGGLKDSLRGVIVSGGALDARALTPTRIAFSIPFVNAHSHPLVAGPVFASHPLDLQSFHAPPNNEAKDEFSNIAHVGPPSVNVEIKMANVDDASIENGADPTGYVLIRGPSVTLPMEGDAKPHTWMRLGDRATVQTNGTFKVLSSALEA